MQNQNQNKTESETEAYIREKLKEIKQLNCSHKHTNIITIAKTLQTGDKYVETQTFCVWCRKILNVVIEKVN